MAFPALSPKHGGSRRTPPVPFKSLQIQMVGINVNWFKFGVAAALCCASAARADSFLEVINGTGQRSGFVVTNGTTQLENFVIGRLRYVVDVLPGESAYMTFTVLGPQMPTSPSFQAPPGAALSADGRSFSLAIPRSGVADFGFARADRAQISNQNNASWQDMNFGILLDANRLSGRLLLEDALLGNDFDYNDLTIGFQMRVAPVPEPSTYALALAGLGVLGFVTRRRRHAADNAVNPSANPSRD
jgi:hypothetical protein